MPPTFPRRWWALGALTLAMLAVALDTTVLAVALPALADDLHASTSQLQWFTAGYTLALAAVLLPAGLLGDRFGRKRLLLAAIGVFGLASAACALCQTPGQLVVARVVLGLAAAFLMPLTLAVLPVIFTAEERGRALSVWVTASALGLPLGPLLGGWLLSHFWWGSVFWINVPVMALAALAVTLWVPESRSTERRGLDPVGVALSSAGLAVGTYGVIEAGERGWGAAVPLGCMLGGLALLGAFVGWQRHAERTPGRAPLVDRALVAAPGFGWGAALATLVTFVMTGLFFALPQYFGALEDAGALGRGLRLLPVIGGLLVGTRGVAALGARLSGPGAIRAGLAVMAAAMLGGALVGADSGFSPVAAWTAAFGVGLGAVLPAAMNLAMATLGAERAGAGSAVLMAARQVGGALGVAVLGSVLDTAYRARLGGVGPAVAGPARSSVSAGVAAARRAGSVDALGAVRSAFAHGQAVMLAGCAALALAGLLAALALRGRPAGPLGAEGGETTESEHEYVA